MVEAEKLYRKIARINGKELPEEGLEIDTGNDTKQRFGDFRDLFKTKYLTKTTLSSTWTANIAVAILLINYNSMVQLNKNLLNQLQLSLMLKFL